MPTLHLLKLCVGVDSVDELRAWQAGRLAEMRRDGRPPELLHRTFQAPKRTAELLDGGSLYWVIKGAIQARQRLTDIRAGKKDDGSPCAVLVLDETLVPVRPAGRRPFQGWRYLQASDAPPDLGRSDAARLADLPPRMRKELAELGLL
jgi:hypothetical protein